ncbi:hypothetical protein CYMTET_27256 [Cymbomonas tetramitiformis]|uniref:Uncharacterized protein n=1 Tax=Cymbomonas tetramitiformis TaxID=36881 RepID=A0AAE0FQ66_9CHLO|nr:hypothetical protein CYMTET_27256 [Cymbomonas tetramitiformis]
MLLVNNRQRKICELKTRLLCVHEKCLAPVNNVALLGFYAVCYSKYPWEYELPNGSVAYDIPFFAATVFVLAISTLSVVLQNFHPELRAYCNAWHILIYTVTVCCLGPYDIWLATNIPVEKPNSISNHIWFTEILGLATARHPGERKVSSHFIATKAGTTFIQDDALRNETLPVVRMRLLFSW